MANCKRVMINGDAPFNVYEDKELQPLLAYLAGPVSGLRLNWINESRMEPNDHGGKTTFFYFRLEGEDSVSYRWLALFTDSIKRLGGRINCDAAKDLDA